MLDKVVLDESGVGHAKFGGWLAGHAGGSDVAAVQLPHRRELQVEAHWRVCLKWRLCATAVQWVQWVQ